MSYDINKKGVLIWVLMGTKPCVYQEEKSKIIVNN